MHLVDFYYKNSLKSVCLAEMCSSSDSSSEESSTDEEDCKMEELERKQLHPHRLHPEMWYNDSGEVWLKQGKTIGIEHNCSGG